MKTILIARKELAAFFNSLMAYIILVIFLAISGFFTWLSPENIFHQGSVSLGWFFNIGYWTLYLFIPAVTMRVFSEEYRNGTIELLLTKSITLRQIILGKFLACWALIGIALLATLPYYYTVSGLGKIDHATVWGGYLGLMMIAGAYASIGVFASSTSSNQIIAFIIALSLSFLFHFIFGYSSSGFTGTVTYVLSYLSIREHFESITRGVVDTKDLIFFFSIIFFFLSLTAYTVSSKKGRTK